MATTKPRINVTLEQHRYDLFKRLAALQGVSMSSLVAELLEAVADPMERVCVVLEAAKAVLVKHIPQLVEKADVAERASGMTLKEMQDALRAYSPDLLSDAVLQKIDVDLATLPAAS